MSTNSYFNSTHTTKIYTLSLHDSLPILRGGRLAERQEAPAGVDREFALDAELAALEHPAALAGQGDWMLERTEEDTSELPSRRDDVCRLLLQQKNITPESTLLVSSLITN